MGLRAKRTRCRPVVEGLEWRVALSGVPAGGMIVSRQPVASVVDPAGAVSDVTDPRVVKQGGAYYLFSSGVGVPIRRSTNLTHWEKVGRVFDGIPAWARARVPAAQAIWAPDVSFFDGEYHLYYAVSQFGTNRSVIGLATNATLDPSSPLYRWVDRGEVIRSRPGRDNWNAIDPQVAFDGGSRPWLVFGSQWSGIKLTPLDPSTGKLARGGPRPALRTLAARPGGGAIEAPFLFRHGGWYYLFVSFDRCCLGAASTYKVMVGRSSQIAGPYSDRGGRPMTRGGGTLVLDGEARYRGPGHNDILEEGGRTWILYHAYDARAAGTPKLQVRPITWGPDGWPVVGAPLF